jgi:hypothetical protein
MVIAQPRPLPLPLLSRLNQNRPVARPLRLTAQASAIRPTQQLNSNRWPSSAQNPLQFRQMGIAPGPLQGAAAVAKPMQPVSAISRTALFGGAATGTHITAYAAKPQVAMPLKSKSAPPCALPGKGFAWLEIPEWGGVFQTERFPPGSYQVASLGRYVTSDIVTESAPLITPSADLTRLTVAGCQFTSPGTWLSHHEGLLGRSGAKNGPIMGHTLRDHVAQTQRQLQDQIRSGNQRASTFYDASSAQNSISLAFRANRTIIRSWSRKALPAGALKTITVTSPHPIGWGISKDDSVQKELYNIRVRIVSMGNGRFKIHSAFPDLK